MKIGHAGFAKDKYLLLSKLGSEFDLSFSSHLVLGDKLIALDGKRKTLLICEPNDEWNRPSIIQLDKLAAVFVKKSYGSIRSGELKHKGFEEFLKAIDLQFEYIDNEHSVVLNFYDSETNLSRELPALERNAKNWQLILSTMIPSRHDKTVEGNGTLSSVE